MSPGEMYILTNPKSAMAHNYPLQDKIDTRCTLHVHVLKSVSIKTGKGKKSKPNKHLVKSLTHVRSLMSCSDT